MGLTSRIGFSSYLIGSDLAQLISKMSAELFSGQSDYCE
jgi:hypothetical protein